MNRPRVGFVGTGWIGRHRMEAILETGAAEAIAIVEPDEERAAEARQLAPTAKLLPSLDALLELAPDGVVIATPNALHADQSITALESGAAVFCQKPLGRSAEEVHAVLEAARKADRLLRVDLSYRYTDAMRAIRSLIQSGEIGRIYAANLTFHNAYGPDKPWFYDSALSGGGCVMDLGVHLVDMALWSLGFPEVTHVTSRLFAGGCPVAPRQVEDYGSARLDLADGTTIQIACSWRLPAGCDAIISAEFYGTSGGVRLRNEAGSFLDFTAERLTGTRAEIMTRPPDSWGGRAAADWAGRLAESRSFAYSTSGLLETARILDRIYVGS
jgi:predicted dehydrogenase